MAKMLRIIAKQLASGFVLSFSPATRRGFLFAVHSARGADICGLNFFSSPGAGFALVA
jgi:hypothetical protein